MFSIVHEFQEYLKNNTIKIRNSNLNSIAQKISFYFLTGNENNISEILSIKVQHHIIIDEYSEEKSNNYLIIFFDETLIIIQSGNIEKFYNFFNQNLQSQIYFLSDKAKEIFTMMKIPYSENQIFNHQKNEEKLLFQEALNSLMNHFVLEIKKNISSKTNQIQKFFSAIKRSICYFLLIKIKIKSKIDRFLNYNDFFDEKTKIQDIEIQEKDYIKLLNFGHGSNSFVYLIYHFPSDQILIQKIFTDEENSAHILNKEKINYLKLHHPFFPRYFGTSKEGMYSTIIIEYIEGNSLQKVGKQNFSKEDKIKIIFQIMIGIEYLHLNQFIIVDLKPDNIIIDENKSVYFIDFDRMIQNPLKIDEIKTRNFGSTEFLAPEISLGQSFTNKCDIYSLGMIIDFIYPNEKDDIKLQKIINNCIQSQDKRPNISELIDTFYSDFFLKMTRISELNTIRTEKNIHTKLYFKYWYFISEYKNLEYQFQLGQIHKKGKIVPKDLKKALQYFTYSSSNVKSLTKLGYIYTSDKYNYSNCSDVYSCGIFCLQKAASQNYLKAQIKLGIIYAFSNKIKNDFKQAIYFLTLAANQNSAIAQNNLGSIYYCVPEYKDI